MSIEEDRKRVIASLKIAEASCSGCKAQADSQVGSLHFITCGLNREPVKCDGPYDWPEFWLEVEKD